MSEGLCETCGQVLPDPTSTLGAFIRNKRVSERLSVREAGRQAKIAFTTVARLERGELPNFINFCKVVDWLGLENQDIQALIQESIEEVRRDYSQG